MLAEDSFLGPAEADSRLLIQQMSQSLGLLRVAFDSTGEAMLIIDESSLVRWANQQAADLWGGGITVQMVGQPLSALLQFYDLYGRTLREQEPSHPLQKALSSEGCNSYLIQAQSTLDNDSEKPRLIFGSVSWRPIIQMNQRFILLIIRDLDPLEKALARQRQFIDNLAHELRTPLAIISGNLHRLRRKEKFSEHIRQSLCDATAETQRMAALVDNLLLLSELDTNCRAWKLKVDDLRTLIDQWTEMLDSELRGLLTVDVGNEADDYQVQVDQDAFVLILDNLLDNSLRFCKSKPLIRIHLIQSESHLELRFIDNGPGLQNDDECLAVFDRFTRIQEHRNLGVTDGGGLGLPLVKSLMEGMGGSASCLSAQSQTGSSRQGLVVSLLFPRAESLIEWKSSVQR